MSVKPKFAAITLGLAIGLSGAANAAWQPVKPIEFIATAGPGGGTDNFARAVQSIITKHKLVEQPIVVTNKGGGSGAEGYTYTKAMAGDPYKIVFGTSNAWTQPMVSKVAYNYTDLTPIASVASVPNILVFGKHVPFRGVPELIDQAKKNPGKFSYASAGNGTSQHLAGELFQKMAGVKLLHSGGDDKLTGLDPAGQDDRFMPVLPHLHRRQRERPGQAIHDPDGRSFRVLNAPADLAAAERLLAESSEPAPRRSKQPYARNRWESYRRGLSAPIIPAGPEGAAAVAAVPSGGRAG